MAINKIRYIKLFKALGLAACLVLFTHCATDGADGAKDEEFASFDESATTQAPTDTSAEESMEKEMSEGNKAAQSKPPENAAKATEQPTPVEAGQPPADQNLAQNNPPPNAPPDASAAPNSPAAADEFSQFDSAPAQNPEPTPPPIVENALPPPAPSKGDKDLAKSEPAPPPPQIEEAKPVPAPEVAKPSRHVQIRNLQFKANDGGGGALSIEASGPFTYSTRMNPENHQFIVEIPNATISKVVSRGLNTKDFSGGIGSVDSYESSQGSARIVVQLREGADEPLVNQEGNTLVMSSGGFPKPSEAAPTLADANSTNGNTSGTNGNSTAMNAFTGSKIMEDGSPARILSTTSLREFLAGNQKFYGKKISFEANDADIKEVFKFLSEESGINLVLDDTVAGKVTVRFRDVPWDQVLFVLMQQKGLGYIRSGQILRVTKMEDLKKQEDDYQHLEEDKEKILPLVVKMIPISYAQVGAIATQVKPFGSKRAQIVPDPRTSTVLVSDIPEAVERIEKIIKSLDTPPLQVLIEAKIVEALDTFTHFVGVNWSTSGGSPVGIGYNTQGAPNNLSLIASNGKPSLQSSILDLKVTSLDILGDLDAALSLGESTSEVRVLSSPRIMAMQNEAASITQQINTPYTTNNQATPGAPGSTGSTVQIAPQVAFLMTQLSLNVTPQITNDASVILTVDLQRSFPVIPNNGPPGSESRQAKTKIMVKNGQTAVIGGIYQSDSQNGKSGIPYLDDVPVLGWLFKSETTSKRKNELLVFMTPRILGQADMGISTLSTIGSSAPKELAPMDAKVDSLDSNKTGL